MKNSAFGSRERLKKSFEFRRVRENGSCFRGKTFGITVLNSGTAKNRLGLSVGSKAVPLAVNRNCLKRLIRETFRLNKTRIKNGPHDIVVFVKRPIKGDIDCGEAKSELLALMGKARIL